jgi:hypothetical protein
LAGGRSHRGLGRPGTAAGPGRQYRRPLAAPAGMSEGDALPLDHEVATGDDAGAGEIERPACDLGPEGVRR